MKKSIYLITIFILSVLVFSACQEDKDNPQLPSDPPSGGDISKVNSCEGCHADYEHLKSVHTPDPPAEGEGGCGGEVPHIEPYDRVYLGGDGYAEFKNSIHGELGCVACHNGIDGTDNKDEAHSGEFLRHPSSQMREKCAPCHPNIVNRAETSLHVQGWGQKNMVTIRSGLGEGPEAFDKLTDMMKEGYNKNCAKCHGSCGECHITRPVQGGGGLYKGHKFNKTPHIRDNCTTCHVSRGGHAYFGVAVGTKPDVHLTKNGYKCIDCHSKDELHGEGKYLKNRWEQKSKPMCEDCHSDINNSNTYHSVHMDSFNCQTCHSQDYNNCGSCHIPGSSEGALAKINGGAGARIPSHQKFKIGMNPIPEIKPYKMATLRQSLSAPDSWSEYGTANLSNFDAAPTYKYTTPHNILRWTQRTEVEQGKACFDACHIIKDGDTYRNKEYYLFQSDLEDYEINATKHLTVDGQLPSSWDVQ